jgi:D-tyrosyl-tRNA(Tyr) deacylase
MRAVVQRVSSASVTITVAGAPVKTGGIGQGLVVYLGVGRGDATSDAEYLADKIANLRVFVDTEGKMNLSLLDLGYEALVISQFTLYADARKGRRPSYSEAAENEAAMNLYEYFCGALASTGIQVETGRFREVMRIESVNEGPVTILLDSSKAF